MTVPRDITVVIRALRRRPGMVAAVVITLALGIGANTAVFSLIDAVLLRPLAVADSKPSLPMLSETPIYPGV